jgi:hypothetical protein
VPELIASLPVAIRGAAARQDHPAKALLHPHKASKELRGDLREDREQAGALRAEPLRQRHRRADNEPVGSAGGRERGMKVAYWPGCVSRGFTPELHGAMAARSRRCSTSS